MVLNETNRILNHLDHSPIEVIQKVNDEKLSRRAFFTSMQTGGKQLARSMAPVSWKMEAGEWNLANYYQEYQFYTVEIDKNKCILCQACFSFCSQKVFKLKDSFLQIENEKCVNCMDCTDICPEYAIQIKPEIKEKSDSLETFHTKQCRDCGKSFHTFQPEIEKCHICVNRDPEWLSPY
jgi:ferredoxin